MSASGGDELLDAGGPGVTGRAPAAPARRQAQGPPPRSKLVFGLVTVGIALGAIEIGQRISDWRTSSKREGRPMSAYALRGTTSSGLPLSDKRGSLTVVHDPFVVYRFVPGQIVEGVEMDGRRSTVRINSSGLRGRDTTLEKPAGVFRVAVLGGSTAFGWGAADDDRSPPAALERALAARLGVPSVASATAGPRIEVLNAAAIGYESTQELVFLATRVLDHRPDAIVLLDGWNDVYHSLIAPAGPSGNNQTFLEIEKDLVGGRDRLRAALRLSAFFRSLESKAEKARERMARSAPKEGAVEPPGGWHEMFAGATQFFDDPGVPARYRRNVERMCRLARASGTQVVIALQPEIFHRADPVPEAEAHLRTRMPPAYRDRVRALYPELAAAAEAVAAAEGAVYVDARRAFDGRPEAVFVDPVHLTEQGAELLADADRRRRGAAR